MLFMTILIFVISFYICKECIYIIINQKWKRIFLISNMKENLKFKRIYYYFQV